MNGIGHTDMLVEKRETAVRNLSPGARHAAFPQLYARPVPLPDPTKPLLEKLHKQGERIKRLEAENERLKGKFLADAKLAARITVNDVLDEYCKALTSLGFKVEDRDLTPADLTGPRRAQAYVMPRHVAMWLTRRICKHLSFPRLGVAFAGRDHSSIHHGCGKASAIMEENPVLKAAAMVVLAGMESRE